MSHVILMALAPLFFVMALGYLAGRARIIDNQQVGGLNSLTMDFALPASLFAAMAAAPRAEILAEAPLFVLLGLVMLAVFAGWYVCARRWLGARPADAALQALTVGFPNLAGVGLPISAALLGASGTVQVAVAIAAGSIIVSPITLVLVELQSGTGGPEEAPALRIAHALKRALVKPIVIGPAAGIAVSLVGIDPGPLVHACLSLIGQAAAGVALFLTGLVLSAQPFRPDGKVIAATLVSDLLRPLLAAALVFALPVPMETARTAILLAAVPSGFFGILFAVRYGQDSALDGSIVIASTLFSAATMAVVIGLLFTA